MQSNKTRGLRKEMTGTVVSDKMDKTIVVRVGRQAFHRVFKKTIRKFNTFKVHDEKNEAKPGDTVKLVSTRPLSKGKSWALAGVLEKAKE